MRKIKKALNLSLAAGLVFSTLAAGASAQTTGEDAYKAHISSVIQKSPLLKQTQNNKTENPTMSADTLVIKYTSPLTSSQNQKAKATMVQNIKELQYAVVKVHNKDQLDKVINQYMSYDNVISVKPSVYFTPFAAAADPKAAEQYHLSMLQIAKAQGLAGKNKVKVAVIDQGIDRDHPELKNKLGVGYNMIEPLNQPWADFHGTHVAGIIGAEKGNGTGGYGINPNVEIISIDVFNRQWGATDYDIAEGILQAVKSGAKVINMSLGSTMNSPLIEDAVKQAVKKNVVVVAAAGNFGDDIKSYPAANEGVISVGAINDKKELAEFSSYGPSVDLVAPGEAVYAPLYDYEKGSTYAKLDGTSMASPVVAGVASLLLSKYPNLTPLQVEYILEKTATDLGDKGFDVKYANGLVNPVAALQFDIKKIPALSASEYNKEEILKRAVKIDPKAKKTQEGNFVKPYEQKWYQFNAAEGEYIQLKVTGSANYDYALKVHVFGEKDSAEHEVNMVAENLSEGKLVKVPFSGTVAVAVVDANGNYDNSGQNRSHYALDIEVTKEIPEAASSFTEPVVVESLPYSGEDTFVSADFKAAAEDYYKIQVDEPQVIRVELSGVPGVNSAIEAYFADEMMMEEMSKMETEMTDTENPDTDKSEGKPEEIPVYPFVVANNKGYSEGEVLTFEAMPGQTYIIKVTNDNSNYFGMYDYFLDPSMGTEEKEQDFSLIPYYLDIHGKVLPPDEDGLPFGMMPPEEGMEEEQATLESQKASIAAVFDMYYYPEDDYVTQIENAALPYEMGTEASGYLQMMDDEDWFAFEASTTGVYQFGLVSSPESYPMMEIYEIATEKTPDGEEIRYLNWLGSNISWDAFGVGVKKDLNTALRKGKKYLVKLNENYYEGTGISFNPYAFTSKVLLQNHEDQYEDNNETTKVKDLPGTTVKGNFGTANDRDVFYFKSSKDALYGVTVQRGALSDTLKKLPKELVAPFYSFVTFIEDTNNNRTLDDDEWAKVQHIDLMNIDGITSGSISAKKGKNYFVILEGYADGPNSFTLWPYEFKLQEQNRKDEDAGSVVKGNVPSKPLALKKTTSRLYTAKGYLNAGVKNGDEDWYKVDVSHSSTLKFRMSTSHETDAVVEVYQNGKLIHSADEYAWGDDEVFFLSLKPGTYHVKVRDANNNAALSPYEFKVYFTN
ncbi:subtilisin family serine protease [Bacillus oleivorans]|uniref:Subtilisin family serine protease n=1 Tax=Bacillus oleivorans TaxID=1448271 RepID=A0A285CIJ6_9BACI|nr:S8 family serine peptidase [Bacillus oleivorans]SNX67339.1 subtilisin family serine protease [Bacillus oleivorans]